MDYIKEISEHFPVRKTAEQKLAFRTWALGEMKALGYKASVEENGHAKHRNLVAGDPEHAAVVFTAHYDTGARMLLPDLVIPRNVPVFIAYQVLNILLLFIPALLGLVLVQGFTGMPRLALLTMALVFIGLLLLETRGPACKHSANGGDSGVAALLMLMAALPEEARSKAAFILFDHREMGRGGSKAYGREHLQVQFTRLTVNLDCLGNGESILCVPTELARKCTGYNTLERLLADTPGMDAHFFPSRTTMLGGDHKSFKSSVALVACRRTAGVGFLIPSLRTGRDTVCEAKNLSWTVDVLRRFLIQLTSGKEATEK